MVDMWNNKTALRAIQRGVFGKAFDGCDLGYVKFIIEMELDSLRISSLHE